uniref:Coenzyme Q-binding protein COQ10 n=1 Tax=Candidatus Kentrum sp. SD TaxID=2126332 RepID=A0A450YBA3_9GAMM|nr:MAG: coenzyme Q-binding protein COQ10 [Candidatus Kentron sp. SD]VFK43437.1 MAG: coenzyme Q-binding protein COQ10 [Candidatus Kentron sp. SD]
MTTHTTKRIFPYPADYVFDLVTDVERYPDFLPYWRRAEIYARDGNTYHTDQEIWMGMIRERFRTKTVLKQFTRIDVTLSEGFFRDLAIRWEFEPMSDGGCEVVFTQSWELQSFLKQQLVSLLLAENSHSTINAFEKRAHELCGIGSGIQHDHHSVTTH